MHKVDRDYKQEELLISLEAKRLQLGASQEVWASTLQLSQGHYSKIIRREVSLSNKVRARIDGLLKSDLAPASDFEKKILGACRASQDFRDLIAAALRMHEKE